MDTKGNGEGLLRAPSIAVVTAPPTTSTRTSSAPPGDPPSDPRAELVRAIARNAWGARAGDGRTVAEHLEDRVTARATGRESAIATPWESVNAALGGGLWPGFHVVVGATGAGKSQWAMQVAMHAAESGVPSLYLALELDAFGLFCRAASLVSWGKMRDAAGVPNAPNWSELYTGRAAVPGFARAALERAPLHWCEAPPHGFPYGDIAPAVEALRAQHPEHTGPVLVVLDFLQLVSSGDAREDIRERIGRAAYACRAIARELGAVVVALSSTARPHPGDKRLTVDVDDAGEYTRAALHDLVGMGKESGDVEYSADSVMVLCREAWPDGEPPPKGGRRVHLAVAKLRAGTPSWCVLAFQGGTRFVDAPVEGASDGASSAPPPPPPPPPTPRKRARSKGATATDDGATARDPRAQPEGEE